MHRKNNLNDWKIFPKFSNFPRRPDAFAVLSIAVSFARPRDRREKPIVYCQVDLPNNSVGRTNCFARNHWTKVIEVPRIFSLGRFYEQ